MYNITLSYLTGMKKVQYPNMTVKDDVLDIILLVFSSFLHDYISKANPHSPVFLSFSQYHSMRKFKTLNVYTLQPRTRILCMIIYFDSLITEAINKASC